MQCTANTTLAARIVVFFRTLFPAHTCAPVSEFFSIHVPGMGVIGSYASVTEVENALHHLSYGIQERAEILDSDGYCLSR